MERDDYEGIWIKMYWKGNKVYWWYPNTQVYWKGGWDTQKVYNDYMNCEKKEEIKIHGGLP